jgi:hypothetical protein
MSWKGPPNLFHKGLNIHPEFSMKSGIIFTENGIELGPNLVLRWR